MVSTGNGITWQNVAKFSRKRLVKETFLSFAADDDYIVDDADISAAVVGSTLALTSAADAELLPYADFLTLKVTDASGTNLSLTVKIRGYYRGVLQEESITATGAPTTGTTTKVFDQVVSVTVTAIANKAASDLANVGFTGTRFGLFHGIAKVSDVKRITKRASAGTPSLVAVDTNSIDLANQALKISAAAGDLYIVEYLADVTKEGFAAKGAMAST